MSGASRPLAAEDPLESLDGIGPARARALREAGIAAAGALCAHLPRRYEDRRSVTEVAAIAGEGAYTVIGRLAGVSRVRLRRRGLSLVRGRVEDASGALAVAWFNRPYLASQIDAATEYTLHGRVRERGGRLELLNPSLEPARGRALFAGSVVPVYPPLGPLGPAFVRRLLDQVLERLDPERAFAETLPAALRRKLPPLGAALARLHRPQGGVDVEALNAGSTPEHARLAYGELLDLQLRLARSRARLRARRKAHGYRLGADFVERQASRLPFTLTGAQRRAAAAIVADLERREPMLRLLQGDVGSGKTAVAAIAVAAALDSGLQAAFMAPTEILAEQQARAFEAILGGRYRIGLLTASASAAEEDRRGLADGSVGLAVGTHALIQDAVTFRRLGLAVIDEQHRFGVAQRRRLLAKGDRPDLLVMTATPIPRSLALAVYGDLDLTILDELPPGRRPPRTRVVPAARRERVYAWLERELEAGHQAYVVMPLIEESERVRAASIEGRGRRLAERFARFRPRRLHGRTPVEERDEAMRRFAAGEARLLIATTVIEVGLDVPAADRMVIESAERLGLAQLHQLRGRIGRGGGDSVCVALQGAAGEESRRRLEIFGSTVDGFELADADLEIRGPGELLGTRQAGLTALRFADLVRDRALLERARRDARRLAAGAERSVRGLPAGWAPVGRA